VCSHIPKKKGRIQTLVSLSLPCQTARSLFKVINEQAKCSRGMILSFESVIRSGYWLSHHLDDRLTNRLKQRDPVPIKLNAFLGFCQEKFVAPLGSGIM